MFGWRKRSEGFEWREYVRTTVLVRRADRQRRMDDARLEALAKITDVRDRGVEAGRNGAAAAAGRLGQFFQSLLDVILAVLSAIAQSGWRALKSAWSLIRAALSRVPMPELRKPSLPRLKALRVVSDTALRSRAKFKLPRFPDLPKFGMFNVRTLGIAAAVVAAALGLGPMLQSSTGGSTSTTDSIAQIVPRVPAMAAASSVTGRATAVTGALLRVNGELVELKGIEAPHPKHPCLKANGRRWSCGSSATNALNKILRAQTVTCEISGRSETGRAVGTCRVGESDIAAELVRNGHVFAESGLFSAYSSDEAKAKDARTGLWQGETVSPQEWRTRTWEEAKRTAPDGCPIKGFVRASSRIYAMPWSSEYASAKVRQIKGERWFCSEDDARAAGFKLSSRS